MCRVRSGCGNVHAALAGVTATLKGSWHSKVLGHIHIAYHLITPLLAKFQIHPHKGTGSGLRGCGNWRQPGVLIKRENR